MRRSCLCTWAVALVVLLLLPACAGDGSSDAELRRSAIPSTLRGFLLARGVPQIYAIAFATDTPDGAAVASGESIRRVEAWTWTSAASRRAVFDSGFLVEDKPVTTSLSGGVAPRSPTEYHGAMTPADVERLLGGSYTDETGSLGQASLVVRRYEADANRPPQAFGFLDGRLTSVVVGAAMETQP